MKSQEQSYAAFREISQSLGIVEAEWHYFQERSTLKQVNRGTRLIQAGEGVERVYFCVEGLFRYFYVLEDGREYNKSFSMEKDFVTSYGAMISGTASHFSVEALEDSLVIEIPYKLLQELMERHHAWERLVRCAVEQLYLKKEERERQLLFLDAAGRYRAFCQAYPGLLNRVPQYHIASYLGISAVSLSRLKKSPHS